MTQPWAIALLAALAVVVVTLVVGCALALRRTRREVTALRAQADALRSRLDALDVGTATPRADHVAEAASYVITGVGEPAPPPTPVDSRLFADVVLRETVVRAASLGHGVRRAMSPEVRHRIRFEMRREVKRARKQRRSDLREARRAWQAAGRQQEDAA